MLCKRPEPVLKAYVSEARPFLPSSGTQAMEGVGLHIPRLQVCHSPRMNEFVTKMCKVNKEDIQMEIQH
jgi:hypothetical protein